MSSPLELLPSVVHYKLMSLLDNKSLLTLRRVSRALKNWVEQPTPLLRLQVKVRRVRQIKKMLKCDVPWSNVRIFWVQYSRIYYPQILFIDKLLTHLAPHIRYFESGTWLTFEQLEFIMRFPKLERLDNSSYYKYEDWFPTGKIVSLHNLREMRIRGVFCLEEILQRAPNLRKLYLYNDFWHIDADSMEEYGENVVNALLSYITTRFHRGSGPKGRLEIDLGIVGEAWQARSTLIKSEQLMELCKLCYPARVVLQNVRSFSLPLMEAIDKETRKVLDCIGSIVISTLPDDDEKCFPLEKRHPVVYKYILDQKAFEYLDNGC